MSLGQILFTVVVVVIWTWIGANYMDNMGHETPKGMKAIVSCFIMGPLLGTLLAGIILWEMGFGDEKKKRQKEEMRQYQGDELLKKIHYAMDNPTYQFEVDGEWLARDAAIKKLITNYFRK